MAISDACIMPVLFWISVGFFLFGVLFLVGVIWAVRRNTTGPDEPSDAVKEKLRDLDLE